MLTATHSRALIASSPLPTRHLFTSPRAGFFTVVSSISNQPIPRQPASALFSRATSIKNSLLHSTPSLFRTLHSASTAGPESTLSTKLSSKRLPAHSPPSPSFPHSLVLPDGSIQVQSPLGFEGTDGLVKVNARLLRDYIQRAPHPPSKDYITLSYYQFRPIPQKEDLLKIQYFFLTDLRAMDVVGRIYVSAEGINAQISCPKDRVEDFKDYYATQWPIFDKIRFNPAMSEGKAFKKLHVRIKGQLVADGIDNSSFDIYNEPTYLTPEEWHNELSSQTTPPILIDMRNHYESSIGHFEHAIRPDVTTFKENVDAMLDICKGKEDQEIYMYCTGGIRCTRSGALLKSSGFKSVKMLRGGVTAYGRYIQDQREQQIAEGRGEEEVKSIYKGKNFTFDKRLGEPITDEVLATCHICGTACDTYSNCSNMACNLLMISCPACQQKHQGTCGSGSCVEMVQELNEKQKKIDKNHPGLRGMKARLGVQPFHEHRLRVRPLKVMETRRNKARL
ncbi:hypothetical protein EC957_010981 [Mortierella hygrophila]|uniref:Rhodanese domain-containing protein n=1 Tax=Mortierella hygrophila TaxID=979708 RepID=A0A9P6K452_9FUNG|nr:hypothetical protein EC957_010981 [Mortierella hygrophila]